MHFVNEMCACLRGISVRERDAILLKPHDWKWRKKGPFPLLIRIHTHTLRYACNSLYNTPFHVIINNRFLYYTYLYYSRSPVGTSLQRSSTIYAYAQRIYPYCVKFRLFIVSSVFSCVLGMAKQKPAMRMLFRDRHDQ